MEGDCCGVGRSGDAAAMRVCCVKLNFERMKNLGLGVSVSVLCFHPLSQFLYI